MRAFVLLATALAAVLLAGCSGVSSGSSSLLARLSSSAEASEKQGTARFEIHSVVDDEDDEYDTKVTMTGAVDFANGAIEYEIKDSTLQSPPFRSIIVDGTVYTDISSLNASLGGLLPVPDDARRWISMEAESGMSPGFTDPAQMFGLLTVAAESVTKTGAETIRGADTTRYSVFIDPDAVANEPSFETGLFSSALGRDFTDVAAVSSGGCTSSGELLGGLAPGERLSRAIVGSAATASRASWGMGARSVPFG